MSSAALLLPPDRGERGGAAGVEMALLWGVLLLLILAVVQIALLWGVLLLLILAVVQIALLFYAGQLALTAAQDGLRSGRAYSTEPITDAARHDTESFLARSAGTTLTDVTVTTTVDDTEGLLTVRVTGTAMSLIPGVPLSITREAVGGLERPTP